jgi:Antitoxin Xre/MbcA/ParS C-terminal toxin-binding domain/Antitoxin Xre-like helix-turn-helix domain
MPVPLLEPEQRPETTAITDEETGAMLRAFFRLSDRWALSDHEARILLGQPAPRTFARWKSGTADLSRVPHDTRQRLSMLMGIHKGLRYMFPAPGRGYAWLRRANRAFAGQSALERMLSGEIVDLAAVRSYLDAEVGGW